MASSHIGACTHSMSQVKLSRLQLWQSHCKRPTSGHAHRTLCSGIDRRVMVGSMSRRCWQAQAEPGAPGAAGANTPPLPAGS